METVLNVLLVRFGVVVAGVLLLGLLAVAALAVLRRSLRTPESRERASSAVRSAAGAAGRRSSGGVTGSVVRRAGELAASRLERRDGA